MSKENCLLRLSAQGSIDVDALSRSYFVSSFERLQAHHRNLPPLAPGAKKRTLYPGFLLYFRFILNFLVNAYQRRLINHTEVGKSDFTLQTRTGDTEKTRTKRK